MRREEKPHIAQRMRDRKIDITNIYMCEHIEWNFRSVRKRTMEIVLQVDKWKLFAYKLCA